MGSDTNAHFQGDAGGAASRDRQEPIIVSGGGIGGLAVALTLARSGHRVHVLEQAREFSEIGAGLQLGPNAIRILRRWGVMDILEPDLVAPDDLRMMDGLNGRPVGVIPLGSTFADRFGAPYYVAHRGDLHRSLLTACRTQPSISLDVQHNVVGFEQDQLGVRVSTADGRTIAGKALVGADGLWSKVRQQIVGDGQPDFVNHTSYRALIRPGEMPAETSWKSSTLWAGPDTHLVHYPICGGRFYNVVATVASDWRDDGWNKPGDKSELLRHFAAACAPVRHILAAPEAYRKWALADRPPVQAWSQGRATLLGDAAHPVLQYYSQGAAMALEDADCLAAELARTGGAIEAAFGAYERARIPRTARLYHEARKLGQLYHARGLRRFVRNLLMPRAPAELWYEKVSWVYG